MTVSPVIKSLAIASLSAVINFTFAQGVAPRVYTPQANIILDSMVQPRMKKDWDNPGAYEIVANLTRSAIYKNDTTTLNAYITGYGLIGNCKLFFLPSSPIFSDESLLYGGLNPTDTAGNYVFFVYGKDAIRMPEDNNMIFNFAGLQSHHWKYPTMFIDFDRLDSMSFSLLSEKKSIKPPFQFKLKSKEYVEPGDYTIGLYMTYFNGAEWKISKLVLPIHVNNVFEQNPIWVNGAALLGALIAAIAFIVQIISFFRDREQKDKTPKKNETQELQETKETRGSKGRKKTPEQKHRAKIQRREFVSKWVWKLKSIFLSERTEKSPV